MSASIAALGLALALFQAAAPAQPAGQDPVSELPEVVVEGRTLERLADEFIDTVAAPPRGATVARWNERVCVGAVGFRADTARYLIDRVSSVADDLGVRPGEPGCDPTVVIIATLDGGAVARGLVERRGRVLRPGNSIESRSRAALEAFVEVERPVRWWHISTAVDPITGRSTVRSPGRDNFNSNDDAELLRNLSRTVWGSTLQSTVRHHLRRAIIIIDFDALGDDVDFDQLADYVAFIALAQVDPDAETSSFSTILNLFDDPTTPGLTEWDRAYLQGLYASDDSARGNNAREAALRREMVRARQEELQPEAE